MEAAVLHIPKGKIDKDYAELKRRVVKAGLLEKEDKRFCLRAAIVIGACVLLVAYLFIPINIWIRIIPGAILGAFLSAQLALLSHDLGHNQAFTGRFREVAKFFFFCICLGGSFSWWIPKHNLHHAKPNRIDEDPDVRFTLLAFAPEQLEGKSAFLRFLIRGQRYLIVLYSMGQAVNARISGIVFLCKNRKGTWILELTLILAHIVVYVAFLYYFFGWFGLWFGIIHQVGTGMINTSLFAANHKGMLMLKGDENLGFFREQVFTSRDVTGGLFTDVWYGGLNHQIAHHLFQSMPRHRLRFAMETIIQPFCEERGITCLRTSAWEAYGAGFSHLGKVAHSGNTS